MLINFLFLIIINRGFLRGKQRSLLALVYQMHSRRFNHRRANLTKTARNEFEIEFDCVGSLVVVLCEAVFGLLNMLPKLTPDIVKCCPLFCSYC